MEAFLPMSTLSELNAAALPVTLNAGLSSSFDGVNLDPPLATVSTYTGIVFISRCRTRLEAIRQQVL
jgi:hypothetical protein